MKKTPRQEATDKLDELARHYLENMPQEFKTYADAFRSAQNRHPSLAAVHHDCPILETEDSMEGR